jgi:hypothetical protein
MPSIAATAANAQHDAAISVEKHAHEKSSSANMTAYIWRCKKELAIAGLTASALELDAGDSAAGAPVHAARLPGVKGEVMHGLHM